MTLPVVMPANNPQTAGELHIEYPHRIGVLLANKWRDPGDVPFVLDNGRYAIRKSGDLSEWDETKFRKLLDDAKASGKTPQWIVVPDVPRRGKQTLEEWNQWVGELGSSYGWPMALAVQEGITLEDVKALAIPPDVIFVGGPNSWRWRTLKIWCDNFSNVHVGAIKTPKQLWAVQHAGAESSDSNVWRPIGNHLQELRKYLEESESGMTRYAVKTGGFF